ncbi:MAG: acyltransferase family protein [Motilibacteraceae bacterium]
MTGRTEPEAEPRGSDVIGVIDVLVPEIPADEPARTVDRLAGLEGYRGLAAVLIVVYHVYQFVRVGDRYPLEGTWAHPLLYALDTFVGLFFVLSAFLLGLPFARRALEGGRAGSGREFLRRRAVRIVPLYYVAVLVVWASRNGSFPGDWRDLLEHLTFTQVFDQQRIFYTIGPAWSLAVEVQFYLLLALLGWAACALCARLPTRAARTAVLLSGVAVLFAGSIVFRFVAERSWHEPVTAWPVWFSLPARLDEFALGLALSVVVALRGNEPVNRPLLAVLLLAGAAFLAVAVRAGAVDANPYLMRPTWAAIGFSLLLMATALSGSRSAANRLLDTRPLAFLGLISYSLYLWHEPVLLWLDAHHLLPARYGAGAILPDLVVVLAVSVLVAWLSYWVIEYPTSMLRRTRVGDGSPRDYYTG